MVTTITKPSSDFTARDFDSWIVELRTRANAAFPAWTDFNTANFGNILLEMFAHTLDVCSVTQDNYHLERFSIFARLRRSMIWLGKWLGFTLPGPVPASVDLEFTFADGAARVSPLRIPAGTAITTPEGDTIFYTLSEAVIGAGSIQVTGISAENAQEHSEPFVADGSQNLSVTLANLPFVDDSLEVVVGVDTWTEVENFYDSGPADKHFRVEVDEDDRATIIFGDGTNGAIPLGAGTATYKSGGGAAGNVDANTLTEFLNTNRFNTDAGQTVQVTVRNPAGAAGGVDRMSVEEARVAMPAHVLTSGARSVTQLDFENNARKVRGVARAMLLTSDDDPSIDENRGELYIIPVGGGLPSAALKTEVLDYITDNYPPTLTFSFTVEDPSLRIISVGATVFLAKGVTEAEARAAVEDYLDDLFSLILEDGSPNPQIDFGYKVRRDIMPDGSLQAEFPWSDLFNAVRDAATATGRRVFRKVDEDTFAPSDDVIMLDTEFPVLGSITLINGDTGLTF